MAKSKSYFTLTPIISYQTVHKVVPTPRVSNELSYGLSATYGLSILSAEAEVTQSKEDKFFSATSTQYSDKTNRAKLGIRTAFHAQFIRFFMRGGIQAKQSEISTTVSGVSTTSKPDISYDPYAGAGLGIQFLHMFRLNAGYTAVFHDKPNEGDIDSQYTLGFSLKI